MPTSAVIHIQNNAPGPPRNTAVATPAMFPVPIVADRAVINALNGVIWPSPSSGLRPLNSNEKPVPIRKMGISFSPTCKNSPTPRMSTSINGPQTTALTAPTIELRVSMSLLPQSFRYFSPRLRHFGRRADMLPYCERRNGKCGAYHLLGLVELRRSHERINGMAL